MQVISEAGMQRGRKPPVESDMDLDSTPYAILTSLQEDEFTPARARRSMARRKRKRRKRQRKGVGG